MPGSARFAQDGTGILEDFDARCGDRNVTTYSSVLSTITTFGHRHGDEHGHQHVRIRMPGETHVIIHSSMPTLQPERWLGPRV